MKAEKTHLTPRKVKRTWKMTKRTTRNPRVKPMPMTLLQSRITASKPKPIPTPDPRIARAKSPASLSPTMPKGTPATPVAPPSYRQSKKAKRHSLPPTNSTTVARTDPYR